MKQRSAPGGQKRSEVMNTMLCAWKNAASRGAQRGAGLPGRLAGATLLALLLGLLVGISQAGAAPRLPNYTGRVTFSVPNYRGVIGGPIGTRVVVSGSSWLPYANVTLSLTLYPRSCAGAVPVSTYQTTASGSFSARFDWPAAANVLAPYYACATQANKGTAFSYNAFTVLASSPASLNFSVSTVTAGSSVTVIGNNWLPGGRTITVVILPCKVICQAKPVAEIEVISSSTGFFSQPMTIMADATSGTYYAQASNTESTLSAVSTPLQVAGQATPGGTPLPGSSPTTSATRTTPGVGLSQPPSQAKAALKDALLAAGLGLAVLLVLLGAITFFIGRSRGAQAQAAPKAQKEGASANAPLEPGKRVARQMTGPALPDPQPDAQGKPSMPGLLPSRRGPQETSEEETHRLVSPALPKAPASDDYPWEHSARQSKSPLPAAPGLAPGANPQTLTGQRPPPTFGPPTGPGQQTVLPPSGADGYEE